MIQVDFHPIVRLCFSSCSPLSHICYCSELPCKTDCLSFPYCHFNLNWTSFPLVRNIFQVHVHDSPLKKYFLCHDVRQMEKSIRAAVECANVCGKSSPPKGLLWARRNGWNTIIKVLKPGKLDSMCRLLYIGQNGALVHFLVPNKSTWSIRRVEILIKWEAGKGKSKWFFQKF